MVTALTNVVMKLHILACAEKPSLVYRMKNHELKPLCNVIATEITFSGHPVIVLFNFYVLILQHNRMIGSTHFCSTPTVTVSVSKMAQPHSCGHENVKEHQARWGVNEDELREIGWHRG